VSPTSPAWPTGGSPQSVILADRLIFEGNARIDPAGPRADAVPAYVDKYREFIDSYGRAPESFADDYPHVIRVSPTRVRIW
jgi:hypothetical protein